MTSPANPPTWLSRDALWLLGLNGLAVLTLLVFWALGWVMETPQPGIGNFSALAPGVPCYFKWLLHLPCPFCGMTRSFLSLMHGEALLSLRFHPLGLPFFLFTVAFVIMSLLLPKSALRVARFCGSRPGLVAALVLILAAWTWKLTGDRAYW